MNTVIDRYIDIINNEVEKLVKSVDEDYTCSMGTDFLARFDTNSIEWSLLYTDDNGISFYNNFIERFPRAKRFGLFTLSVLHEIGHLETEDEWEDDTEERNREDITCEEYFNLHNEYIATDWAGRWLDGHLTEAAEFDKEIYKIIHNFYSAIGLRGD